MEMLVICEARQYCLEPMDAAAHLLKAAQVSVRNTDNTGSIFRDPAAKALPEAMPDGVLPSLP
jgi:hypothetical protein